MFVAVLSLCHCRLGSVLPVVLVQTDTLRYPPLVFVFCSLAKKSIKMGRKPGVVAHAYTPIPQEVEAAGLLGIEGQPVLRREYQNSQGYIARPKTK